MMSLTFGLFTQVSGLGPLGPLVFIREGHLLGLYQYSRRWTFFFRNNSKNLDTSYYSGSDFVVVFFLPPF